MRPAHLIEGAVINYCVCDLLIIYSHNIYFELQDTISLFVCTFRINALIIRRQ